MLFKKETEYALRALVYIQNQNTKKRHPGIIEIAGKIDAPQSFTAKILQRLVKQEFIESMKGKNGGFFFNIEKPDLILKNVIIAIEGDRSFTGCGLGLKSCDENCQCPIHESYSPIRKATEKLLNEETIQNLAKKNNGEMDIVLSRLDESH